MCIRDRGWTDDHLHSFFIHGREYRVHHVGGLSFPDDPTHVRLADFRFRLRERFLYTYDFGDHWVHEVRLEKVLPIEEQCTYPLCIGGARACPPEDCGGPWSFLALRDHFWLGYTIDRTLELLKAIMQQHGKLEEEERGELRQLLYWLHAHRFHRYPVNRRLQWYATDDPRWRDMI